MDNYDVLNAKIKILEKQIQEYKEERRTLLTIINREIDNNGQVTQMLITIAKKMVGIE